MCGDPSITYPYLPREAISDELLIAGGIIITGLTVSCPIPPILPARGVSRWLTHLTFCLAPQIALGECYRVRFRGVSSKAFVRNCYVSCLYKELGCFLFGCCIGQSLTNVAKLSVGRLRPHFLSLCGVTYASLNCTPGTYVATVNCHHRLEEEARCVYVCVAGVSFALQCLFFLKKVCAILFFRKSFFSGHASFAMYTMLYLAVSIYYLSICLLSRSLAS